MDILLLVVLHMSSLSEGKSCSLSKEVGPCRFTEPCKPTLFSFNESFIAVSWEGLFEGCHENQIEKMSIKVMPIQSNGGNSVKYPKKIAFSTNETFLEKKHRENESIALRIDFTADHMKVQGGADRLDTHSSNCTNMITRNTVEENNNQIILVSSLSAVLVMVFIIILVIVWKKKCRKAKKVKVEETDMNPVYGDYYYQDGGRRQNVVEVSKTNYNEYKV